MEIWETPISTARPTPALTKSGLYRVVVYAEDYDGLEARPLVVEVRTGWAVYLPLILKGVSR